MYNIKSVNKGIKSKKEILKNRGHLKGVEKEVEKGAIFYSEVVCMCKILILILIIFSSHVSTHKGAGRRVAVLSGVGGDSIGKSAFT